MELYNFTVKDIKGEEVSLSEYKGRALLIVNTASKCGYTHQYKGLEQIYSELKGSGFEVLAFPCNQFGGQEPDSEEEIASFCDLTYSTSFPLFSKIDVNGKNQAPLYEYLKAKAPGILGSKRIKWNFTKFLIDKEGNVLKRYAPKDTPEAIKQDITKLL